MLLVSKLGKQRQMKLYEFEASIFYRVGSRIAKATQRNPLFVSLCLSLSVCLSLCVYIV